MNLGCIWDVEVQVNNLSFRLEAIELFRSGILVVLWCRTRNWLLWDYLSMLNSWNRVVIWLNSEGSMCVTTKIGVKVPLTIWWNKNIIFSPLHCDYLSFILFSARLFSFSFFFNCPPQFFIFISHSILSSKEHSSCYLSLFRFYKSQQRITILLRTLSRMQFATAVWPYWDKVLT